MSKVRMVCSKCGSDDVLCDAYASWNEDKQEWELAQAFDKGSYCQSCDGECRIDEEEIQCSSGPSSQSTS